jgi:hypothetical protein
MKPGDQLGLCPNVLPLHFAGLAIGRASAVIGFFQIAMRFGHKMLLRIRLSMFE